MNMRTTRPWFARTQRKVTQYGIAELRDRLAAEKWENRRLRRELEAVYEAGADIARRNMQLREQRTSATPPGNTALHPLEQLAGSIAAAKLSETLRSGHDVEIPALGIVIKGDVIPAEPPAMVPDLAAWDAASDEALGVVETPGYDVTNYYDDDGVQYWSKD